MGNGLTNKPRKLPKDGAQLARELGRMIDLIYEDATCDPAITMTKRKASLTIHRDGEARPFLVTVKPDLT